MATLFDPLSQALLMQAASPEARQAQQLDELFRTINAESATAQNAKPLSMPFPGMAVRDAPPPQAASGPKTQAQSVDSRYLESAPVPTASKRTDRLGPANNLQPARTPSAAPKAGMLTPPMATPDFAPTFAERLTNFGNALTSQGTVTNFDEMQRQRQSTFKMLKGLGFDDDAAKAAALNPDVLQTVLKAKYGTGSSGGSFGKQVVWGYDEEGNWVPLQVSSEGIGARTQLPPGIRAVPPGDVAEQQAHGREFGKEQAGYEISLPTVMNDAAYMIKALTDLRDDPSLDYVVGRLQGSMISPNLSPGSQRAQSRIDQILGKTFLQAFNSLRGGGQITEAEGRKATDALTRLANQRMSNEDYRLAIQDLIEGTGDMINAARVRAGKPPLPPEQLLTKEAIQQAAGLRPGGSAPNSAAPVQVQTLEEAMELEPGTLFLTPDGRQKVR